MAITVEAHKLAYMALPKAGCTSVKRALAQIDPNIEQADTSDVSVWHSVYQTRRFHRRRWNTMQDHFRFCVVRDPIKRLMSCYSDIVAKRDTLANSRRLKKSRRFPTDPDPDFFFFHLDAYKSRSSLVKHHAISASVFLGRTLHQDYHRVYRTNEMEELGHDLSRHSGRIVQMPHSNATRRGLAVHDLLDETIDALRPFLDHEYEVLGEYFTNPLGPRLHAACAIPN